MNNQIFFWDIFISISPVKLKISKLIDYILGGILCFLLMIVQKKTTVSSRKIKRILVIRPGGIGDAVILLPYLNWLKTNAGLSIDILCESRNQEIFSSQVGLCHRIFLFQFKDINALLKENCYDVVIDTEQWHYLSAVVARLVRSFTIIGFNTRVLRSKLYSRSVAYHQEDHESVSFHRLFKLVNEKIPLNRDLSGSFKFYDESLVWAKSKIFSPTVVFYLGASISLRRLTFEQSKYVIQQLLDKKKRVVLIGGKDVLDMAEKLAAEFSLLEVNNLAGTTNLEQTAAMIKLSELFVGTDSGIMHLAAAVGTPVVAFFGPGNIKKWAPLGSRHRVISEEVSCSPCTHFGYTLPTCHGSFHCMRELQVVNVFG